MNQFAGSRVVEQLSRAEFEQLSVDEQNKHVQDALAALRESIPHSRTEAGAFIDLGSTSKSSPNGRRRMFNGYGHFIALQ
jgi:hypothetical protein